MVPHTTFCPSLIFIQIRRVRKQHSVTYAQIESTVRRWWIPFIYAVQQHFEDAIVLRVDTFCTLRVCAFVAWASINVLCRVKDSMRIARIFVNLRFMPGEFQISTLTKFMVASGMDRILVQKIEVSVVSFGVGVLKKTKLTTGAGQSPTYCRWTTPLVRMVKTQSDIRVVSEITSRLGLTIRYSWSGFYPIVPDSSPIGACVPYIYAGK